MLYIILVGVWVLGFSCAHHTRTVTYDQMLGDYDIYCVEQQQEDDTCETFDEWRLEYLFDKNVER